MALKISGPLKFSQLQAEFGDQDDPDTAAISLGEYYRNGPNVPRKFDGSYVYQGPVTKLFSPEQFNGIVLSPGLGVLANFVLNTGVVQVRRYWRQMDADAIPPLCPQSQVGKLGRGGGEAYQELGSTSIPATDQEIWFFDNQEIARYNRPDWKQEVYINTNSYKGYMGKSNNNSLYINQNLPSAGPGTGFAGTNPYGGSYRVDHRWYYKTVIGDITVNDVRNINTGVPNQGNAITLPDNFYGTTNKTS